MPQTKQINKGKRKYW